MPPILSLGHEISHVAPMHFDLTIHSHDLSLDTVLNLTPYSQQHHGGVTEIVTCAFISFLQQKTLSWDIWFGAERHSLVLTLSFGITRNRAQLGLRDHVYPFRERYSPE